MPLAQTFLKSKYTVYDGKSWRVILNADDQSYLGRCIVFLKGRVTDDPLSLCEAERRELWCDILPRLAAALKRAFGADRINYAHQANVVQAVHWHVVPRYEKMRELHFAGEVFWDSRPGVNYALSEKRILPEATMKHIQAALIEALDSPTTRTMGSED